MSLKFSYSTVISAKNEASFYFKPITFYMIFVSSEFNWLIYI